jgi:ribosomal protein L7Ae-like RNA K-turn-binding protein
MTEGKIFLIDDERDNLIPMVETDYTAEEVLQVLLTRYPDLLPGDQLDPEAPRRWLLVAREMGVPGAEHESERWSLDHLFLDQDGIPTFVECKRATDTRARREVVAQMLDYAANGIEYWGMDRLRQAAAETARAERKSLDEEVQALQEGGDETDVEAYWNLVESNLQEGRVRLIFVADNTPPELRRLVEFLNEKMLDVEVLAVEVKQFLGKGQKAIVPRVIGMTESARRTKRSGTPRHTNRAEFMSKLPAGAVPVFEQVLDKGEARGHTVYWGVKDFSLRAFLNEAQQLITFMYGRPEGFLEVSFAYLPISEDEAHALRQELEAFGSFSGERRLRAEVVEATAGSILEMYDILLERMDDITRRY